MEGYKGEAQSLSKSSIRPKLTNVRMALNISGRVHYVNFLEHYKMLFQVIKLTSES